jgi:hypothetical protein
MFRMRKYRRRWRGYSETSDAHVAATDHCRPKTHTHTTDGDETPGMADTFESGQGVGYGIAT